MQSHVFLRGDSRHLDGITLLQEKRCPDSWYNQHCGQFHLQRNELWSPCQCWSGDRSGQHQGNPSHEYVTLESSSHAAGIIH